MTIAIQSILPPPSNTKGWPTLPTIREEPSLFHMVNTYQQRPKKSVFYERVVNDLKTLAEVEPELLAELSTIYTKKIAQDYVSMSSEFVHQQDKWGDMIDEETLGDEEDNFEESTRPPKNE